MTDGLRLQIMSLIVMVYIVINYFSAKRRKTKIHRIFSVMVAAAMGCVLSDLVFTIVLENTGVANNILNKLYLIQLGMFVSAVYFYTVVSIRNNGGRLGRIVPNLPHIPFCISVLMLAVMKVNHVEIDGSFYNKGIAVYALYIAIGIYVLSAIIVVVRCWKMLPLKSKEIGLFIVISMILSFVAQVFDRRNIITSLGIAFINLSIYLLAENPDSLLIEQLQYEKDRANAANFSKSSFIAHVSHEIRTPINAILGMNEMIIRESKEDISRQYAQDISNAAYALYGIINDVLDMSKIESGKMDIVPVRYKLDRLLYDTIAQNQVRIDNKKLDFYVEVNPSIPNGYFGDDMRIKQVLSNLLSNAVKYTHEGFVRLIVDGDYQGEYMRLCFQVKDTGIGIKEEDISRLFVAFERIEESRNRNIEGTGIGMNITNRLLRLMGSRLQVNSIYGEGSIFSFNIYQRIVNPEPIGDFESFLREQKRSSETGFRAPTVRILVVDDNTLNRRVFISLLSGTQMHIDEASNGYECLEKIAKDQYDIIFLDHMMPDMDGIETLKRIKENKEHLNRLTPVIMLTANAGDSSQEDYRISGFDGYLSKPIFSNELERIIKAFLPSYKIETDDKISREKKESRNWKESLPQIRGIDWSEALKHLPSEEILKATLKEFHRSISVESKTMDTLEADLETGDNLELFRIRVHALKSSSALIGADMLSEGARELEDAAKRKDVDMIRERYPYMINYYRTFIEKLAQFDDGEDRKTNIDFPQVIALVEMVRLEMDDMNKLNAYEALEEIEGYVYPEEIEKNITKLRLAVDDFDTDLVGTLVEGLLSQIREYRDSLKNA